MEIDDSVIEGKTAELDTLQRSINALKREHRRMVGDFIAKSEEKRSLAEDTLERDLQEQNDELAVLKASIEDNKNKLASVREELVSGEALRQMQKESLLGFKVEITREIRDISIEKNDIETSIRSLKAKHGQILATITNTHTEISEINDKKRVVEEELTLLRQDAVDASTEFEREKRSFEKQKIDYVIQLNHVRSQLDEVSKQLVETRKDEEDTRIDFASRSMQLDNRESAISEREAKVSQQEKRTYNYNKFTGL